MKKLLTLLLLLISTNLPATDIWVSPKGNDIDEGSIEHPKATIAAALRQIREWRRLHNPSIKEKITIHLAKGVHFLYESLFIRPEDSGTIYSPTIIQGEKGSSISGGIILNNWKKQGKLWVVDIPLFNGRPLDFRQLWINGQKAVRARDIEDFENMHHILSVDNEKQMIWIPAKAAAKISKSPYAEMVLHQKWEVANLRIKSIKVQGDSAGLSFHNPESRIQFEHPWPTPMVSYDKRSSPFYLVNAKELLDRPGEWYHDIETRKLYYYPRKGENISEVNAIVPAIETLVQIAGTIDNPVKNIQFKNVRFNHTTWMRPSLYGHVPLQAGMYMIDAYRITPKSPRKYNDLSLDNQGWLGRPAASIQVRFAQEIDFLSCDFEHLGSAGLDYIEGIKGGLVEDCLFRDIAGNGLVIGNFSPAAHETHRAYDPTDNRELCTFQTIRSNLFTDVTNEDWGCVAICAGYVADITIEHNEISEVSYSGISLGWGWTRQVNCMRNNRIRANLIHHFAKHLYDTGGIYTLSAQPQTSILENALYAAYRPGYVHRPNHWFYIYTDEGSSFITIKNNWTDSDKFHINSNGPGNVWKNNGPMVNDSIKTKAGLLRPIKR